MCTNRSPSLRSPSCRVMTMRKALDAAAVVMGVGVILLLAIVLVAWAVS